MKYLLCLLFCLCLCLHLSRGDQVTNEIASNELMENGTHVCYYTTTHYKQVRVSYIDQTVATVYYKSCGFWGCKTKSRQKVVTVMRWREEMRQFKQKNFYCCQGWLKKTEQSQDCLKPICTFECFHGGECIAPDTCKCKEGYEGKYCQLVIDDCASKTRNDCEQICISMTPGHRCTCRHGWELKKDLKTCKQINECLLNHPPCSCKYNDGVCNVTCVDTPGSYLCTCSHGYHLNTYQQCEDTNECFLDPDLCDQICVNTPGSYECRCMDGYQLNNITKKCVDINECADHNGHCSDECINIEGSYVCACPPGFYLGRDRRTCILIKPTMRNKVICQSDHVGNFSCLGDDERLMMIDAMYGRLTKDYCQHGNYTQDLRCSSKLSPLGYLKSRCDNMASCVVLVDAKLLGDPCPAIEKYLQVTYDCME